MTRVLLLHPRPTRGGFTAVVQQSRQLLALGLEVSVAVSPGPREIELPTEVNVLHLPRTFRHPLSLWALRRLIRAEDPQIIHWHGRKIGLLGRAFCNRRKNSTVLYTPHGTPWTGTSMLQQILTDACERVLLRRTDAVLCVSRAEQYDWIKRSNSSKIKYLPNVLDADTFNDFRTDPEFTDQVLIPSGYHPQKRLEVVLQALALVAKQTSPSSVIFCGPIDDDAYLRRIKTQCDDLGVAKFVTFLDRLHDVEAAMRASRLVILPSYSEGMPIVGQEAISAGARVAWSAIPPHFELFGNYGAPFWDATELAELLMRPEDVARPSDRQVWLTKFQSDNVSRSTRFWLNLDGDRG